MKISYEKHGVDGIENCLSYLAAFDSDDIDSDEFEIIGEDEEGRDGYADISIINLAEEACKALSAQRKRIAELEGREAALAAHVKRLTAAINPSIMDWLLCGMAANGRTLQEGPMDMLRELRVAIVNGPATSLARRDALKQTEALEKFAEGLPKFDHMGVKKALLIKARALRRQAEAQQ